MVVQISHSGFCCGGVIVFTESITFRHSCISVVDETKGFDGSHFLKYLDQRILRQIIRNVPDYTASLVEGGEETSISEAH